MGVFHRSRGLVVSAGRRDLVRRLALNHSRLPATLDRPAVTVLEIMTETTNACLSKITSQSAFLTDADSLQKGEGGSHGCRNSSACSTGNHNQGSECEGPQSSQWD